MTLQNQTGKSRKRYTALNDDRRIKRLSIPEKRKSSGWMPQAN